jgi:periplasmic divalent cation tolerance protein
MTEFLQVVTTVATREEAERIASELVERRWAACAQVAGPIRSTYRWQGAIESSDEWTYTLKTHQRCFTAFSHAIRELHPYETPEILATSVTAGDADYLAWLDAQLARPEG